jgi:hypothetical protein
MRIALLITAVGVALVGTACSPTSPPAAPKPSVGTTSQAPVNPDAGLLTGTQLKVRLAPASWFPRGFVLQPQISLDTGSYYQPPSPHVPLRCSRLDQTGWVSLGNGGAVSFAQNAYIDPNLTEEYAQEIDVYQGTAARQVMANLRKAAAKRCQHFYESRTSSTVTVKLRKGPQLGDDALTIRLQDPRWLGETTLEAVRLGTAVVTVYYSSASGTGQTQATKLAGMISANLEKTG